MRALMGLRGYFELEEALANAFALRTVADEERDALTRFTRRQPRGYDLAERYLGEAEFRDGCGSLLAHLKGGPGSRSGPRRWAAIGGAH